jgi:hypothetical protein
MKQRADYGRNNKGATLMHSCLTGNTGDIGNAGDAGAHIITCEHTAHSATGEHTARIITGGKGPSYNMQCVLLMLMLLCWLLLLLELLDQT